MWDVMERQHKGSVDTSSLLPFRTVDTSIQSCPHGQLSYRWALPGPAAALPSVCAVAGHERAALPVAQVTESGSRHSQEASQIAYRH